MPNVLNPPSEGCIFDGWRGWRISGEVILYAHSYGMPLDITDTAMVNAWMRESYTGVAADVISRLTDKAEEWLNDNVAKDGAIFGFYDGEFFYMTPEFWQDDDVDVPVDDTYSPDPAEMLAEAL